MNDTPFLHPCQFPGCAAWGAFGRGVALRRGARGQWWCHRHWREIEAGLEAAARAGPLLAHAPVKGKGGQGALW